MKTPEQILDDWTNEIYKRIGPNDARSFMDVLNFEDFPDLISLAQAEERKRCADVARGFAENYYGTPNSHTEFVANKIAEAISQDGTKKGETE